MNGISSIVDALVSLPEKRKVERYPALSPNKTEALRTLLQDRPATCAELAAWTGVPSASISALLAAGVNKGQILKHRNHYHLNPDYEETRITNAIALLRANGYTVEKNNEQ